MEEVQMAVETECANCGVMGQCYNDGEAYVCINREMCKKNARIARLEADLTAALNLVEAGRQEREQLRAENERLLDAIASALDSGGDGGEDILRAALAPEEPRE